MKIRQSSKAVKVVTDALQAKISQDDFTSTSSKWDNDFVGVLKKNKGV
jgi:hypothetical protein